MNITGQIPQPDEKEWKFIEELKTPFHTKTGFHKRLPREGEASFLAGLHIEEQFPDPKGLLTTAYRDFNCFLRLAGINPEGPYRVITDRRATNTPEEHCLIVDEKKCRILADDTEGIRRGLIYLEDEILRSGGAFLPLGRIRRKPVVRTRISRCFYGPINRPPKNRDELADDVNYYPDEYLNRLAHDGTNALWLTITFRDTCPSKIIPEYGQDAARRLAKLRLTVERCSRYGIKIYPFCIEPASFAADSPVLAAHPELKGHNSGGAAAFCTSSEMGQAYLEEATRNLFSEVPGLGGLIVIPVGERFTHCYSGGIQSPNNCPRCSRRKPWEVLSDTLAAMARGMHAVNPEVELIAWPYSQYLCWGENLTVDAAGHMPPNVILQHNYESAGRNKQLGKWRLATDYWLSYVGPSDVFRNCARAALKNGNRVFAKLQVGCSHEVATAPCVPVPGILYEKYRKMHRIGVSGAMQCWYFGNYPSLMTKAAGELSFAPFPDTEEEFLLKLARRDWHENAAKIVKAWQFFKKGYSQYPTSVIFGYYGPMHDGPVWPLYLEPRDLPLAPTWQINFPPSGDRIGECIGNSHTLREIILLCTAMAEYWQRGVAIMQSLIPRYKSDPERMADINVARALGLQFQSGINIIRFYALREKLFAAQNPGEKTKLLNGMRNIVKTELKIDKELLKLAQSDSRLGFHSEAEGYKYFPARIRWRMAQLKGLLKQEFPRVAARINRKAVLFPRCTGEEPGGKVCRCKLLEKSPRLDGKPFGGPWDRLPEVKCEFWATHYGGVYTPLDDIYRQGRQTVWKAGHDRRAVYIGIYCNDNNTRDLKLAKDDTCLGSYWKYDCLILKFEPRRFWPSTLFIITPNGFGKCLRTDDGKVLVQNWNVSTHIGDGGWSVIVKIPYKFPGIGIKPLRLNIERMSPLPKIGEAFNSWVKPRPLKGRLIWGTTNPATDFGWLT